jgi:hypothetical protein
MQTKIEGEFDVTTIPQPAESNPDFASVSRLLLDKRFHGPLDAISRGQMLAVGGSDGWGVYVAMEKVEGTLEGKAGSFVFYHHGTMNAAGQELTVTVAPGSGAGELKGLAGRMAIDIRDGKHFYGFEYSL